MLGTLILLQYGFRITSLNNTFQTFLGAVHYQSNGKWDPNNCSEQDGYNYSPTACINWGEGIKKNKLQEIRTCMYNVPNSC